MFDTIKKEVYNLIEKFGTNNPAEICENLGYKLLFCDLPAIQNGFYLQVLDVKIIVVNSKIKSELSNFYIAHELGHAILHEKVNYYFICANTSLVSEKYEREADLFAATLLMQSVEFLGECLTKQDLSSQLGIPYNVVEKWNNLSA